MGRRPRHDAVVIGGGPAGTAAAVTLARAGRSVALVIDDAASVTWRVGEGAPPGLDRAVDDVFGAGTFVAADHERSYGNRSAWGSEELALTDFMLNPFGAGWHLDRVAFDARLVEVARSAGVEVVDQVPKSGGAAVIDATGRRAAFARRHGARLVVRDRLVAVVAVHDRAASDRDSTTTVEAVEDGWWYTSAIPGRRRVVAFLTDGDLLRSREEQPAPRHIAASVDGPPHHVQVVAAGTAHLDHPVGDGWLATGDAAACFDPLSSQGILTAVLMGREAAEHLDDPEPYADRYRAIVDQYLLEQQATYALEQRWPESPFWSRRH